MSGETSPSTLNKTQLSASYWFAHEGAGDASKNTPSNLPADPKELQIQKDKEERLKIFREQQEEGRLKRLKDLEQQFLQAKKHREHQEEERKRRIEEARLKEIERRQQVEERKRQIWEAEQERKEAILRRNMEREARIEARRNAQRNSQCFAFGSSTPRTFDLDLAAIGIGRNVSQGSVLMSSVSGRRSEERELGPPRATSACSLDRKFGDDCMSRSMVSLSSSAFRGRKRTDIIPTLTRERSVTPHTTPRGNHAMRAVSMTRLDQLAQPRRTYRDARTYATGTTTTMNGRPGTISPSMSKSMCNLANTPRRPYVPAPPPSKGNMSRSMMHLGDLSQDNQRLTPSPPYQRSGMRSAQSMLHLAAAPRLTRAARLRAQALAHNRAVSAWNLNKPDGYNMSGRYLSPGKDASCSPSRPQSSMSGTSEISIPSSSVSAVNMRPRPAPRKPRPYSIAGSSIDTSTSGSVIKKELERQPRVLERNVSNPALHQRAISVGREKNDAESVKPLTTLKKPVPPPKSSQVLARAKSHPVPIKDNLRKPVKPGFESSSTADSKMKKHSKEKAAIKETDVKPTKPLSECKPEVTPNEIAKSSPLISPVNDSELCISSDESKVSALTESEANTFTQSLTESECKVDTPSVTDLVPVLKSDIDMNDIQKQTSEEIDSSEVLKAAEICTENVVKESTEFNGNQESEDAGSKDNVPLKPRITSEEEAKAALAEKRRIAREQAEKEAELERQRQEEIKRKEEERLRLEELEQKRMEEEQMRLAELHRQLEEEKLRKAIEEQQQRAKEEQERREEEAKQKMEKEEQERKAREEAEKQRVELEDRLRKEENERAERKRRVEQIMARTRGKAAAQSPNSSQVENSIKNTNTQNAPSLLNTSKLQDVSPVSGVTNNFNEAVLSNGSSESRVEQNLSATQNIISGNVNPPIVPNNHLPDLLNSEIIANYSIQKNGLHSEENQLFNNSSSVSNFTSNRTLSAKDALSASQTNGYSSHEDMSCTTSPEEMLESGLLISIERGQQKSTKITSECAEFNKLVDFESSSMNNISNDNFLISVDDVNSNLLTSENSYIGYDESLQKKQESSIADLLS